MMNENPPWKTGDKRINRWYILKPGEKYRFRFVNLSAFARYYIFLSDSSSMAVVELDGVPVTPQYTKGIELTSGQRVSVIITASSVQNTVTHIIAVSDPRIFAGAASPEQCNMPLSSGTDVQYTWGWLDTSPPPSDLTIVPNYLYDPNPRAYPKILTTWKPADTEADPFYKYRPKLPFTDVARPRFAGTTDEDSYFQPRYAWDFDDESMLPLDGETAWIPDDLSPTTYDIREIALSSQSSGWGTMGFADDSPTR
jgi:hypothetical protein